MIKKCKICGMEGETSKAGGGQIIKGLCKHCYMKQRQEIYKLRVAEHIRLNEEAYKKMETWRMGIKENRDYLKELYKNKKRYERQRKIQKTLDKKYKEEERKCPNVIIKLGETIYNGRKITISFANQIRRTFGLTVDEYFQKIKACEICGYTHTVDLHHINGRKDNEHLIALCPNHHSFLHRKRITTIEELKKLYSEGRC